MWDDGNGNGDGDGDAGGGESLLTVVLALVANLLVAVAKTVAAVVTGAASMLAEAAHSWADTGNEVLLLIAHRRGERPPDAAHPLGHGREVYVWSLFAAIGLFGVGAGVSVTHGIQELLDPEPAESFVVAYVVLAVAFVLEGASFTQAWRQSRADARRQRVGLFTQVLRTSDPTVRAVFFEDAAALVGIVIAAAGIAAHEVTGSPVPDAVGSILVGLLLGVVAIVLIQRNLRFIVGEAVDPALRDAALRWLLAMPEVARVTSLRIEFVGARRVFLVGAVDLSGNLAEDDASHVLARIEGRVRASPGVVGAVLSLSEPEEPALLPAGA
ncbi:cation diffusion facilitator family transporter [Cellulomonas shaoxiangyii]|uniref:Cation diffusion facilitator family transporter n=1 Tax=Cellulomonas shaoxiangyii TaxID=2566013 RepID=A0A4P7SL89_9CELL|nr:cation diffusion facilitator family transporter [Cellulomonas shaoxiangyii]QCB94681.1 cation diffusion facilitator family transporter [Cellulomonas shaoxiangyii]TGY84734.1 cation diffusion facilitator family transporter [Cellulomonas shaoxiangyii]